MRVCVQCHGIFKMLIEKIMYHGDTSCYPYTLLTLSAVSQLLSEQAYIQFVYECVHISNIRSLTLALILFSAPKWPFAGANKKKREEKQEKTTHTSTTLHSF